MLILKIVCIFGLIWFILNAIFFVKACKLNKEREGADNDKKSVL